MNREQITNQYISIYEGHAMEKEELEIMLNRFADDIVNNLQPSLPSNLDEAAEEWCKSNNKGIALCADKKSHYLAEGVDAFIAGAEWQKERDTRDMIMSDRSYFQKCYELGKKDAEKEINRELIKAMEKVHEIRDVDYDIHIDTSANGSFETISYYENGKLVGQELSKKEE